MKRLLAPCLAVVLLVSAGCSKSAPSLQPPVTPASPAAGSGQPPAAAPATPADSSNQPPVAVAPQQPKKAIECRFLTPELCQGLAFPFRQSDHTQIPGVVTKVPSGTAVYAPMDGYFDYGPMAKNDARWIGLHREKERTAEGFRAGSYTVTVFYAPGWKNTRKSGELVKRGELIGEVDGEGGMFESVLGPNDLNLIMEANRKWHDESGTGIVDVGEYLAHYFAYVESRPLKESAASSAAGSGAGSAAPVTLFRDAAAFDSAMVRRSEYGPGDWRIDTPAVQLTLPPGSKIVAPRPLFATLRHYNGATLIDLSVPVIPFGSGYQREVDRDEKGLYDLNLVTMSGPNLSLPPGKQTWPDGTPGTDRVGYWVEAGELIATVEASQRMFTCAKRDGVSFKRGEWCNLVIGIYQPFGYATGQSAEVMALTRQHANDPRGLVEQFFASIERQPRTYVPKD